MRRSFFLASIFLILYPALSAQDLSYYLPSNVAYNPAIPKPKEVIYHEVGEWHVTHDRLVNYMKAVAAAAPQRIKMETMGYTYEGRPQVLLIITSPGNQARLEEIRQKHLKLTDPAQSASVAVNNMPIVVWIGHSIHGNEPSGANASLLTAYYLAAAQSPAINELLDNVVILFDPSFNPDGLQRFSTWANQHKSKNLVSDPSSREFNEVWPGGRFNHYWFDLNRDWLPAVHRESQNRLKWYHLWKPNILTDHHEQSSNATFFFQPGVPSRVNPLTPARNQELTVKLAKFHAAYLDSIGSLYFTKENYDDFYYGKGSTFPDINGAIGILFEQASSRGHLQQTNNGLLSFPFTIRNQFVTALSTLEGARVLRQEFLQWQRDFYTNNLRDAATDPVKAYVFGSKTDVVKNKMMLDMLLRQQINVYKLQQTVKTENDVFNPETGYVVPLNQPQYRVIKTIFEKTFQYKDSLFYDITSWTMPLAFGMPYAELNASQFNANLYNETQGRIDPETVNQSITGAAPARSEYAYLIAYNNYAAPAALYEMMQAGLSLKVATQPFQLEVAGNARSFERGTILLNVKAQAMGSDKLHSLVSDIAVRNNVPVISIASGYAISGTDLGSSKFAPLAKPSIAMITGQGVNATDAGEVWHLLDQRMNIPATHLEPAIFNRADISRYNTLIMVGGTYPDINKEKLKNWVQSGGVLILTEEAVSWAAQNGISEVKFKKTSSGTDSTNRIGYSEKEQLDGAQQIAGAIFGAEADLSHPLAFGYDQKNISLFKANKVFMEKSRNPYATPFYYGANPLQSGWVSKENKDAIKNSAAVIVSTVGNGRVISIADNPNFRAFWLGGAKLFMNAIFFGRIIDAGSARTE
ncbi:MAG: M14 family metallopeptidase [Bacteroidetes bacterium]|nr:M14 family metallopeptidase [Bacteroidota bacterium]